LLSIDSNTVKFRTNFPAPKFLVYTDNFQSNWQGRINDRPAKIYKTNLAFKGLWLEPGEQTVVLRFGKDSDYLLNGLLFVVFYAMFFALCAGHRFEKRNRPS
jgi:hypothetical protein